MLGLQSHRTHSQMQLNSIWEDISRQIHESFLTSSVRTQTCWRPAKPVISRGPLVALMLKALGSAERVLCPAFVKGLRGAEIFHSGIEFLLSVFPELWEDESQAGRI